MWQAKFDSALTSLDAIIEIYVKSDIIVMMLNRMWEINVDVKQPFKLLKKSFR